MKCSPAPEIVPPVAERMIMFTGIVEERGRVVDLQVSDEARTPGPPARPD